MSLNINHCIELNQVFQCAILELAVKLEEDKATIPARDKENLEYVAGMCQVNSVNLEQVVSHGADYYAANKEKVDRFLAEASGFAAALKAEGYGHLPA